MRAPISNKVSNGSLDGGAAGVVAALLVALVPAWREALPPPVPELIAVGVTAVGYFAGGYLSRHQPTSGEIIAAVGEARKILAADQPAIGQGVRPAPVAPATITGQASEPVLGQEPPAARRGGKAGTS